MLGFGNDFGPACAAIEETDQFGRLAQLVNEVTGFRDGPGLRGKLRSIVGGHDEDTATTWLRRLAPRGVAGGEWQSVVERLTVGETFFFRDTPQLELLAGQVLPRILADKAKSGDRTIRVWSAGCSTGEEPYTLAILVLEAMVAAGQAAETAWGIKPSPGWVVHVYGTDINAKVVDQARLGLYSDFGLSSFREMPARYRRFFSRHDATKTADRYAVRADVRAVTSFGVHNVKECAAGCDFDLVSCRNVLIYFDDEPKRLAVQSLSGAVARNGYLMLGPTDPFDGMNGFSLVDTRVSPILTRQAPGGGAR